MAFSWVYFYIYHIYVYILFSLNNLKEIEGYKHLSCLLWHYQYWKNLLEAARMLE